MEQEVFDIVNQDNQFTGTTKGRDLVHREMRDWHRTTHIWIINSDKEVLCQQRSLSKDKNPGLWQSYFGGHLKSGQTYEQNAVEELAEEIGLKVDPKDLIPVYIKKSDEARHFGQVYLLKWNSELKDLKFNDGEVQQVKWISLTDLSNLVSKGKFVNRLDEKVIEFIKLP